MATTITNDHGTFTGETEAEAMRAARKGAAHARKEEQRQSEARDVARMRAEARGYHVLSRLMEKGDDAMPGAWVFNRPDAQYVPWKVSFDRPGLSIRPEITWYGDHGTATTTHFDSDFLGAVENGAGFPIVAFIRERFNGKTTAYAIGIEQDQACLVPLPTVTEEMFKHSKQCEA